MVEYPDTISALLALASEEEGVAYEADLKVPETVDDLGGRSRFEPPLEPILLERLMQKLREGEFVASGFGFESGQPTVLDARLWQRLRINPVSNSAYDGQQVIGGPSVTGTFHSLGFSRRKASRLVVGQQDKAAAVARLKREFERLDKELPLSVYMADFFREVERTLGVCPRPSWLKLAWTDADLRPERRRAGRRSKQSDNRSTD